MKRRPDGPPLPGRPRAKAKAPTMQETVARLMGRAPFAAVRQRQQSIGRTVEVIAHAANDIYSSPIPQMGAALAFRTIFGLIPVLVVGLVVLGSFATPEDVASVLTRLLQYSGISDITLDEPKAGGPVEAYGPAVGEPPAWFLGRSYGMMPILAPPPATPAAPAPITAEEAAQISHRAAKLDAWVGDLVLHVRQIPFKTIGWIGLATLLYAAISMLVEVERAFNQIYRAPVGRSWVRRLTQYWTLLTLGTLSLFGTFYVGEQFNRWVEELVTATGLAGAPVVATDPATGVPTAIDVTHAPATKGELTAGAIAIRAIGFLVTTFISTLLLLFAYMSVPNTRVRLRPALIGAVIAAVLWETGKWGFTQYLEFSTGYATLYGSIALVPLFLLWVYVTWVIVLLGLHIAHRLQVPPTVSTEELMAPSAPAIVDPASILPVLAAVGRQFRTGEPAEACAVAERTHLGEEVVRSMLERLADGGLLHRVNKGDSEGYFALARPPEDIPVEDVLRIGQQLASPNLDDDETGLIGRLQVSCLDSLRGTALASVLARRPDAPAKPAERAVAPAAPAPPAVAPPVASSLPLVTAMRRPGGGGD